MIIENNEIRNKVMINVVDDPYELYDWCVDHHYFDEDEETFDEWFDKGEDISFFQGDPDMVKANQVRGVFFDSGDKVFFYLYGEGTDKDYDIAEKMIAAYCNAFDSKVTLGGESYRIGKMPNGMGSAVENNWKTYENLKYSIAWRGGAGYFYDIVDCTDFVENISKAIAA